MLKVKDSALPRVPTEGRALERVSSAVVAKALGAEVTGASGPRPQGPVALLALRQGLARRLQSSGGRPGLGEGRRQKIPLTDADWALLCQLAEALTDAARHPTPGQIASELLHQRLHEVCDQLARDGDLPGRKRPATSSG